MNGLLNAELLVGNVVVPSEVSALRPFEGGLVVRRGGYEATKELLFFGAMSLSVFHHVAAKSSPPITILTWSVLTVGHVAW